MDKTKPMYLIVVDLETMGKKPGCIVTEIGAVAIDINALYEPGLAFTFNEVVDYSSSKRAGFKADKKTMEWWGEKLGLAPMGRREYDYAYTHKWRNTRSIKKSIAEFNSLYESVVEAAGDKDRVFLVGNDIDFDKSILEHYYFATNTETPWHYRAWLSLPTFVWLIEYMTGTNVKTKVRETWETSHEALDDAKQETAMIMTGLDAVRALVYPNEVNLVEQE